MKLIAFEGPDRVGKTTQVNLVSSQLRDLGYKVENFKIPWKGDETSFELISTFLGSKKVLQYPLIFQAAQMENRLKFQERILKFLSCDIAIVDRWSLSSQVYGSAQGVNANFYHPDLLEPDLTIIFDGSPFSKENQDTLEKDLELQNKVRSLYAKVEGNTIKHISSNKSYEEMTTQIVDLIRFFLSNP